MTSTNEQLEALLRLKDRGALSQEEFERLKADLVASPPTASTKHSAVRANQTLRKEPGGGPRIWLFVAVGCGAFLLAVLLVLTFLLMSRSGDKTDKTNLATPSAAAEHLIWVYQDERFDLLPQTVDPSLIRYEMATDACSHHLGASDPNAINWGWVECVCDETGGSVPLPAWTTIDTHGLLMQAGLASPRCRVHVVRGDESEWVSDHAFIRCDERGEERRYADVRVECDGSRIGEGFELDFVFSQATTGGNWRLYGYRDTTLLILHMAALQMGGESSEAGN